MTKAGIDMIYLSAKPDEFRLYDPTNFTQNLGSVPYGKEPIEWGHTASGSPLSGRLYVNRGTSKSPATIEVDRNGLHIQFNPSKLLHPFELTTSIGKQVEMVKSQLNDLTIDVDIDTMRLTRVDLAKQKVMKHSIDFFAHSFRALQGKRMGNKTQYPDGFEIGNSSRKAVFYDKSREQSIQGNNSVPRNMLRCEPRFIRQAISNSKSGLGLGILKHIREADPEYITDKYNRFLRNDVFKLSTSIQLSMDFGTEYEVLKYALSQHKSPKAGINSYLTYLSVESIVHTFGSLDKFRNVLIDLGASRSSAYREVARLGKELNQKAMIDKIRKQETEMSRGLNLLIQSFAS